MLELIIALAVIVIASYYMYREAFYNKNDKDVTFSVLSGEDYDPYKDVMLDLVKKAVEIPYEPVYITSFDGMKLFGRYYKGNEDSPFHIQFNGYKGVGVRDFAGGMQLALEMHDNVIVVDQRANGKSEGHTVSFGINERKDLMSWIKYVLETFGKDTDIFLEGVSMGGATVLMANDLDLPKNVKGIIADCPYSSPVSIISKVAKEKTGFGYIFIPFFALGALLYGHFNLFESSAIEAVKRTDIPILIIHGNYDHYVPFDMSKKIKNAKPEIELVEIDGAPHALSYFKDNDKYRKSFIGFINRLR